MQTPPGAVDPTNVQVWYVAEIVIEARVEGDRRNVVYTNFTLVSATSNREAFEKAAALGRDSEMEYENTEGSRVRLAFRGLHELHQIDGPLEHGMELLFEQRTDMPESELIKWVRPRERLAVFRQLKPPDGPNLRSRSVCDELEERYGIRCDP